MESGRTLGGRCRRGLRLALVAAVACLSCGAVLAAAADKTAADKATAQVWLLNTRAPPRSGDLDAGTAAIQYCQFDGGHQWLPADAAAFRQSSLPVVPTTVFVHGNRTTAEEVVDESTSIYRHLQQAAAGRPWRFVIWSWPADRVLRGVRADTQLKATYSDTEAYYLARVLRDGKVTGPLNLIGYSFGARAVTGSLQLLSGGCVAGRQLPADTAKNPTTTVGGPIRVMLVAGAMDCDWLLPGHCEGAALALIDRLFVAQNACDPVLRFYSRLYGRGGPEALGFVGLCGATSNAKIEAADVSGSVGRSHHWDHYEVAPEFVGALSHYAFLDAPSAPGVVPVR